MQLAIVHKATRVIRGVTTDPAFAVGELEELVPLPQPIDLADGPFKILPNGKLTTPTPADLDQAIPERRAAILRQRMNDAIDSITTDPSLPQSLREYFTILKASRS